MSNFWDDAQETGGDYAPMPDGYYPAKVEKATLDLANQYGPRVELVVTITSGDFANRKRWINFLLENPTSKGMLMGAFKKFQVDYSAVQSNEDLGPLLTPLLNKTIEIEVKRGKEKKNKPGEYYDNTYINRVINVTAGGLENHAPTAAELEPPPFNDNAEIPF